MGSTALVTLAAFEDGAVGTVLPSVVRDLGALSAFGLAAAAPAANYLATLASAGAWADRRGPLPALRAGAVAFGLAQLMVVLATTMPLVVAGRVLSVSPRA